MTVLKTWCEKKQLKSPLSLFRFGINKIAKSKRETIKQIEPGEGAVQKSPVLNKMTYSERSSELSLAGKANFEFSP